MKRQTVLFWLALSLFQSFTFAKPQLDPHEYWQDTGLSLKHVEGLTLQDCYATYPIFLGCLQVINTLAEFHVKEMGYFATKFDFSNLSVEATVAKKITSDFSLFEVTKNDGEKKLDAIEYKNFQKIRREMLNETTQNLFTSQEKIPFKEIFLEWTQKILSNSSEINRTTIVTEPYLAATIYNAYVAEAEDPHTYIKSAKQMEESAMADESSAFVGIGALLSKKGEHVIIQNLMDGPALRAGLRFDDQIFKIDQVSAKGLDTLEVSKKLRGVAGTEVTVTVLRSGSELDFKIIREKIVSKNVTYEVRQHYKKPYGYIRLQHFMDQERLPDGTIRTSTDKIADAIEELKKQDVKGWILDLRGNGGGYLNLAVSLSSLFLEKNLTVVMSKPLRPDEKGKEAPRLYLSENRKVTDLPLVILQDAGSASASEIVAGALQDHKRGWILGDRSFGKGSVQAPVDFSGFYSIVKMETVARFYQPTNRTNQIVGILPDFYALPYPDAKPEDLIFSREEDIYQNALPPVGKPWVNPRLVRISEISDCMKRISKAKDYYLTELETAQKRPDYQSMVAEEVLECDSVEN